MPEKECVTCGACHLRLGRECGSCELKRYRSRRGPWDPDRAAARRCKCGTWFTPTGRNQKFCSGVKDCPAGRSYRSIFLRVCSCGLVFTPRTADHRFHSQRCQQHAQDSQPARKSRPPRGNSRKSPKQCPSCLRTFFTKGNGASFCRPICAQLAKGKSTPIPWRECGTCTRWFISHRDAVWCSPHCYDWYYQRNVRPKKNPPMVCPQCSRPSSRAFKLCDSCRLDKKRRDKRRDHDRHRAHYYAVEYEPINRRKVYRRDDWRCGICGEAIDPQAKWPDQWCASLDHIVPVSQGGSHTYANVQAAHWWCNTMKGADESFTLIT